MKWGEVTKGLLGAERMKRRKKIQGTTPLEDKLKWSGGKRNHTQNNMSTAGMEAQLQLLNVTSIQTTDTQPPTLKALL